MESSQDVTRSKERSCAAEERGLSQATGCTGGINWPLCCFMSRKLMLNVRITFENQFVGVYAMGVVCIFRGKIID